VSAAQVGATKRKHMDVDNADENDDNEEASDDTDGDNEKDEQDEDKESSVTKDDDDDEEPPAAPTAASFTITGSEPVAAASSPSISNMVSASRPAVGAAAPVVLSAARKEQVPKLKVVMPEAPLGMGDKGDTLESVYGVGSGDMTGSVRTPEGYLTRARQRLQENLLQQARISALMQDMRNETGFQKRVDVDMTKLVAETQTSALAKMLGGMRKEMRQFARPFYLDHLDAEMRRLKAAECKLQEDLERAEAGMGAGQQGWPDAGDRVVVKTSSFSRPRNTEENAVKKLRIDIPPASLAQKSWSDEKAGAFTTARVSLGAIAAAFILAASA
jgi:hypothetical protein